jgi:hypothetical protein
MAQRVNKTKRGRKTSRESLQNKMRKNLNKKIYESFEQRGRERERNTHGGRA